MFFQIVSIDLIAFGAVKDVCLIFFFFFVKAVQDGARDLPMKLYPNQKQSSQTNLNVAN